MTHHGIRNTALSLSLLVLALPAALSAQPAFQVKDMNTTVSQGTGQGERDEPFLPQEFVDGNGTVFFTVGDGIHGIELWKTDGTEAGSGIVKDICPGSCSSLPHHLAVAGDTLFFVADDGVHGHELWKSDGTEEGTVLLKDVIPGWVSSQIFFIAAVGDAAVFSSANGFFETIFWRSDGTAAGTVQIRTFNTSAAVTPLGKVGETLIFRANHTSYGFEPWKTDGTAAGTVLLKDIDPGTASSLLSIQTWRTAAAANGKVFFSASGSEGEELWCTDGTTDGTRLVKDVNPGAESSSPTFLTPRGNELFFRASEPGHGGQIWKSDGTEAGTVRVTALQGGGGAVPDMVSAAGQIFFFFDDGVHGAELWKTDGTEAGTALVKDVFPGSPPSLTAFDLPLLAEVGGVLVFFVDDGVHGVEPWKSDGTEAGTSLLADLRPGPSYSFPTRELSAYDRRVVAGGRLYFRAWGEGIGLEVWTTDGTSAGTQLLRINHQESAFDVPPSGALHGPSPMLDLNGVLLFQGGDGATGAEIARSDGTAAGTFVVEDLYPGPDSSRPHELTALGDNVFFGATNFRAFEQSRAEGLWKTDGTAAGTALLTEFIHPQGRTDPPPRELTAAGGKLFFTGGLPTPVYDQLWVSDGTAAGTGQVDENTTYDPLSLVPLDDRLLFTSPGSGLFVSDGTAAGTSFLGPVSGLFPTPFAGNVFFSGLDLWKSDGTTDGTVLVFDLPSSSSLPNQHDEARQPMAVAGSNLFFEGVSSSPFTITRNFDLWKTDGTAPGTVIVKDLTNHIRFLTPVGNRIYFAYDDGVHGEELWTSDGTVAGTRMVEDIAPGPGSSVPRELRALGHVLLFSATDGVHGREPWRSNGREAGTRQVQDIAPGALSSSPLSYTPSGANVYFAANDNETGFELWAAPRNALLATFGDVPASHWAWPYIEALAQSGITSGCGTGADYCPANTLNRAEMAVFLGRALHTADFVPPAATGTRFGDVPANYWAASWIEQIATDGVTQGCSASPPLFCPGSSVTRAEMAIFLLRAKHGGSYTPPPATGTRFEDVPTTHWAAPWIEQLAAEGISLGCTANRFCPGSLVTRAEMAVFLTRTFGLATP